MFRRLLIANRGEIALRIVRTCRELGVESVVAHSAADSRAPWVEAADRAVCIGPAAADLSYLDADSILQAAEQEECQAIHPGYGFLAENARFAARCLQQGIAFVGPGPAALRLMGDKIEAKRTMAALGLPTIPGSAGAVSSVDEARGLAADIGYPVLLKAAAGGGGRGMRRCDDEAALERSFVEAALESGKAFGDASLYLEKWVDGGRHVEFQVLVDGRGHAIHLGERECSIQRKHQKLVEESPSPVVSADVRDSFGARVAAAVGRSGYRNAGTVEFLRDASGQFWFMEMNARLQVEHPVTEMITGIDLVAAQLRIAANRPLDIAQSDVRFSGHAIEFRINAEDPDRDFRPDAGTLAAFEPPPEQDGAARIRWDSAIATGYRIPPHYDSLIGKLIVWGPDRAAALAAAPRALAALRIEGVKTTIPFHLRLLADPGFLRGEYGIDHVATSALAATPHEGH